jgi:hypothetical protein
MSLVSSDSPQQHQHNNDDQNCTDKANTAVTVTVAVTAEAATEATQQEDDKNDDKDESKRHDFLPGLFIEAPFYGIDPAVEYGDESRAEQLGVSYR